MRLLGATGRTHGFCQGARGEQEQNVLPLLETYLIHLEVVSPSASVQIIP